MKKAIVVTMAATVVHPDSGEEFEVRHSVDVQEWLDAGYSLKTEKEAKKADIKVTAPEGGNEVVLADKKDIETGPEMTEEDFFNSVKDKLQDLDAVSAKRVAAYMDVEYTNKRDTMAKVEDKLGEDL